MLQQPSAPSDATDKPPHLLAEMYEHPPQDRILLRLIAREHLAPVVADVARQLLGRFEAAKASPLLLCFDVVDNVEVDPLEVLRGS